MSCHGATFDVCNSVASRYVAARGTVIMTS